jgi:hypothetical protein
VAQPASPQPVPKNMVSGRTLTVKPYNFAVTAPGDGWEWLHVALTTHAKGYTYLCRQGSTGAVVALNVFDQDDRGRPDGDVMKGLVSGSGSGGRSYRTPRYERADIPLPGSYRFTATLDLGGRNAHITSYVYWTNRMYVFQIASADSAEPKVLTEVVKSFKLLAPVPPKR